MSKFFKRHSWLLCPATIAFKVIEFIFGIPGHIDDWQTWRCLLKEIDMGPVDVSDWILIALFCVGAIGGLMKWRDERRKRSKPALVAAPQPTPVPEKQAWEVLGARTKRFRIRELAELIANEFGTDAKEEERSLKRAVTNGAFDDPNLHPSDTEQPSYGIGWYRARKLKLARPAIRRYFESVDRELPEALDKRYDDAL